MDDPFVKLWVLLTLIAVSFGGYFSVQAGRLGFIGAARHMLDYLEEVMIACLIGTATVVIFLAVVHRFAAGISFLYPYARLIDMGWAQEACIYMFVWMAKIGAAYGVRTGIHVGVDVLVNRVEARTRFGLILFGLLAGALFTGTIGSFGVRFVLHNYHGGMTSEVMELPSWIVYLAIPVGSYLMCFRFLQVAWSFFRTGELPHHDHAHVDGLEEEGKPA